MNILRIYSHMVLSQQFYNKFITKLLQYGYLRILLNGVLLGTKY